MWHSESKHPSRPANPEAESESLCNQTGSTVEGLTAITKFSIFWCILTITIPPLL